MASAEIIFGEPTNVDGFEGGGHAKSAGALVDGITRIADKPDRDENGRQNQHLGGAIGLEGAWGSGKSTVIEIAEKSLGPKFHVFTFDLWRHQSDDFRRSLLEEFLDYLMRLSENPSLKIDKVNLAKERKAVRNRQTITTTTSKRRYTFSGVIAILALPLLPLLYAWAQPAAFVAAGKVADPAQPAVLIDANRLPFDPMWSLYILAAYLLLFPIIAAYTYIRMPPAEKDVNSDTPRWRRWFTDGASQFLTLSRKEKTNEDIKTIRDEDPTTVEFREVFERILKPIQVDGRRVVFVLDNVDRLPEQDVQRVWSDMRALISKSGKDKSAAVIAVIPYDRNHVAQAFPPLKVAKVRNADGAMGAPEKDGDSADNVIVESDVFEKTFDRIVKVSAPVPSNWKAYLTSTLAKAFRGQHDADAVEKLFRLLKYKLELEGVHPTPRRIISYVNEIGSLWVQWGDEKMPVATIGLYVLHRPAFDRDPQLLSKPHPVDIRFQRIVDDEHYARNLAALAFNVAPELADQVRLGIPIADALVSKDGPQDLKDLSASAGFNELFQDELRQRLTEWAANSPESISRAAMNVDQMELPIETEGAIWQIFADGAAAIDKLDYPQSRLAGLHVIVRRQTRMFPEAIAGQLRKKFEATKVAEKDSAFKQGAEWYGMQRSLSEAIVAATDPRRGTKFWTTSVPTDNPDFNLGVVSAHERDNGLPFSGIRLGLSEDKLSSALLEMLKVNSAAYAHCMRVVGFRVEKYAKAHLEAIAVELSSEPDEKRMRLVYATARIMQWSMPETLREAFDAISGDSLLKYLEWAADTGTQEDYAMSVYVAAAANDGVEIESTRGFSLPDHAVRFNDLLKDASADDEMIEYLVVQIERNAEASAWLGWALDSGFEQGVYRRTVRAMTGVTKIRLRNLSMIAENFSALVEMVGEEGAAFFLSQFEGREEEIHKVFGDSNVVRVPSHMIAALSKMDDKASARTILSLIEGYLVGLDANDWHSALTNPASEDLRLLSAMSEFCRLELKSPDFIRGLVAMCTDVIEGKFDPASIGSVWPQVQKAISPSQYTPLRAQVVAGMRSVTLSPTGSVSFVRHLAIIAQKMRFSVDQSTADMALTQFLWNLANSDDEAATRYLEANDSEIKLTLKAASSDDVRQAYLDVSQPEKGKD